MSIIAARLRSRLMVAPIHTIRPGNNTLALARREPRERLLPLVGT
jgi:hypothetical protein